MEVNDPTENYKSGFILLYRSMMDKGWYADSHYVHLWLHLLFICTHKDREYKWNGRKITLKSGSCITGRSRLARVVGMSESKVERILTYFEKIEQQIEQQKTNTSRLISIVNWDAYQGYEQQIEQRVNNERTTSEQRVNTKQQFNNDNNDKKRERVEREKKIAIPESGRWASTENGAPALLLKIENQNDFVEQMKVMYRNRHFMDELAAQFHQPLEKIITEFDRYVLYSKEKKIFPESGENCINSIRLFFSKPYAFK